MTALEFVASLVSSLAWPAAVVVVLIVLRKPLAALIPLLQKMKYKDLELAFGQRVEELEAEVIEELPPEAEALTPLPTIIELARVSPRSAVLEAWRDVEHAAIEAVRRHGLELPEYKAKNPSSVARSLERAQMIDSSTSSTINELRSLRNQAAHTPDLALDQDSAISYAALARRVATTLRSTGPTPGVGP